MSLERVMIPEEYLTELENVVRDGGDITRLSNGAREALQELETYFVNNVCNGSEQFAWTIMNAIRHSMGVCYTHEILIMLGADVVLGTSDAKYVKYIAIILSLYESINDDVLVAVNQCIIPDETREILLDDSDGYIEEYGSTIYDKVKAILSTHINSNVVDIPNIISVMYDYYESSNYRGIDDLSILEEAVVDYDYNKAIVYLAIISKDVPAKGTIDDVKI